MGNIHNEIYNVLNSVGLPTFYVSKKGYNADEYIIFSYTETPSKFSDDEEELVRYNIYINMYCKNDVIEFRNKIIRKMKEFGYIKKSIPNAYWEDTLNLYNQAFNFVKNFESED